MVSCSLATTICFLSVVSPDPPCCNLKANGWSKERALLAAAVLRGRVSRWLEVLLRVGFWQTSTRRVGGFWGLPITGQVEAGLMDSWKTWKERKGHGQSMSIRE